MHIPVVIQYRHIHLSESDFQQLFGDMSVQSTSSLGHFGQFVSSLSLEVHGKNGFLSKVRILGPFREHTQVELSASDAAAIGIRAPLRVSGDLSRCASCVLKGPKGVIRSRASVFIPARHLHLNQKAAKTLGVEHGQFVSLKTKQEDSQLFDHVTVRVHPTFSNEFHITSDEAAHYWLQTGHEMILCE